MTEERFSEKNVLERIEAQKKEWNILELVIVKGLQELLELTFFETRIPVYIVPAYRGAFSDPIVMSSLVLPDVFPDILSHELIHRLVTHNAEKIRWKKAVHAVLPDVTKPKVYNHVLVHAFHSALYLDILKDPKRLERDIQSSEKWPAYREAWRIVRERGYKELISEFKNAL